MFVHFVLSVVFVDFIYVPLAECPPVQQTLFVFAIHFFFIRKYDIIAKKMTPSKHCSTEGNSAKVHALGILLLKLYREGMFASPTDNRCYQGTPDKLGLQFVDQLAFPNIYFNKHFKLHVFISWSVVFVILFLSL